MSRILPLTPAATAIPDAPALRPLPASALAVDRVTQVYGGVPVLDDVSFDLAEGRILALVGHSGSGKSTLLRVAAGLERPVAGRVFVGGREVTGPSVFVPPEKRSVGLMFQDYALFPHMTVFQNVMFGLSSLPAKEARAVAHAALDRVGLAAYGGSYPHALSGGEQQRVALARALAPRPRVLLMDEPFSNLDRGTRDIVRDETMALLRANGAAAVFVTHDPEDAMRAADRIVLISAGRVAQAGTAEELFRRPASLFVARFFSEFNEIAGRCRSGVVTTPLGAFPAPGVPDGDATLCLRPGAIRIASAPTHLQGRLVSLRFLGETVLAEIGVDGVDRPLQLRLPSPAPLALGAPVHLQVVAGDAVVFADRGESRLARAGADR
jgi:iron(III) transport system ATP-binding protein